MERGGTTLYRRKTGPLRPGGMDWGKVGGFAAALAFAVVTWWVAVSAIARWM